MTKTKYYDLQMDDPQDDYDVEVVNANLKKIDEQMKTRENATDALQEPEFTVADKRENIASKEKMPKILGKIAKFFTDLKTVAFSGKYSDLDGKPAIVNNNTATEAGSALDARQANPTIEGTMANQISQLNSDLSGLNDSLKTKISNPICDRVNILKKITYSNINNWTPVIEYTTKSECILLVDGTVKISTNVPYDGVSGLDVFIQDMWTHLVADKTGTVILPIHWNGLMPLNGKFIVYLGLGEQYTYIINEDSSSDARAFCCNFTELPLGK